MKKRLLLAVFFLFVSVNAASASLIGDFIFLSHRFPNIDDIVEGNFVIVQSGFGDVQGFGGFYTVNPEADSLVFNFFENFSFPRDPFNGHGVDFIDGHLAGITIDTNIQGWDNSRLAYSDHNIRFNWSGLDTTNQSYFYAQLAFEPSNPGNNSTPEPGTYILFILGIIGFILAGRSRLRIFAKNS